MIRILVVEDEHAISNLIAVNLNTIIEVSVHMRRIPCPLFQTG